MQADPATLTWFFGIIGTVVIALVGWNFRMILALNDRQTVAEEKARNHTTFIEAKIIEMKLEIERRLKEMNDDMTRRMTERAADVERRFAERREDQIHQQMLADVHLKNFSEKHEVQTTMLKKELEKIEESVSGLHRRIDEVLAQK